MLRQRALIAGMCVAAGVLSPAGSRAQTIDPTLEAAQSRFAHGEYAQADKLLHALLQARPDSAEAMYLLAFTQQRENQPRESLRTYNAAAKLLPPNGEQLRRVSLNYVLLDDYTDALHWLERAVALDPNNAEAWYDLARVRMHDGRFDLAIDALHRSLLLRPRDPRALGNLGKCLENQNRNDEALEVYASAVKSADAADRPPEQPFVDYGALLNTRDRFKDAVPLLQRATLLNARDAHAWEELGRAQAGLGQLTEAARSLESAVALDSANPRLHYQLARVYKLSGQTQKAQAEFQKSSMLYGGKSAE